MFDLLYRKIAGRIDALITRRILLFHDALVERGQIGPINRAKLPEATEVTHCMEGQERQ